MVIFINCTIGKALKGPMGSTGCTWKACVAPPDPGIFGAMTSRNWISVTGAAGLLASLAISCAVFPPAIAFLGLAVGVDGFWVDGFLVDDDRVSL